MSAVKNHIKTILNINQNESNRDKWLELTLADIPSGLRILDAGAGELRNKHLCTHLDYVSQDIGQYEGQGNAKGLQTGMWDARQVDILCDITRIPEPDASFDVILCSEVFEHLPDPLKALDEFERLLKPGGTLIITAPFASLVHFAPYHFSTGFSRYWYETHLPARNFEIKELTANGDWFSIARQEMTRLPSMARRYKDWCWPLAYVITAVASTYFFLRGKSSPSTDVGCFGWHCISKKRGKSDA